MKRILGFGPSVHLGRFSALSQPLPAQAIPIEVLAPVDSIAAVCDRPGFSASVAPSGADGRAVLALTPPPDLPLGSFEGTVTLRPLKSGETLPERKVQFRGAVAPDLDVSPSMVQVGGRRLGEAFDEVVTLRSLTNRPLGPITAEAGSEGLSVEAVGARQFRVRQVVCRTGEQRNRARFTAEVGGRKSTAAVLIGYTGVGAR